MKHELIMENWKRYLNESDTLGAENKIVDMIMGEDFENVKYFWEMGHGKDIKKIAKIILERLKKALSPLQAKWDDLMNRWGTEDKEAWEMRMEMINLENKMNKARAVNEKPVINFHKWLKNYNPQHASLLGWEMYPQNESPGAYVSQYFERLMYVSPGEDKFSWNY